jgi:hypothetical protein
MYPPNSTSKSFINLDTSMSRSKGYNLILGNSCLYIPPFWWYQIRWDERAKLVTYSFPAPTTLRYVFDE